MSKDIKIAKDLMSDQRIQASIRRLRSMGLKVYTIQIDEDTILLAVDVDSMIEYIRKTVESRITFPNKTTVFDKDNFVLGVLISRSSKRIEDAYARSLSVFAKMFSDQDRGDSS